MVRAPNPFDEFRILTVVPGPLIVTVLDGPVNVEPAPEVSQCPATAHVPEAVIVPEVPPVIVTLATLTVEVPVVNVAPLFTVRLPPVPVKARFAVARFALLFRVSVPPHRSAFVAIVNVAAAVGLNCTLLNSEKPRLPNVMVREAPELKTTVPVPADHDPLVDEFVQEPLKVHVAPPKLTNPVAAMLTLPLIVFVPAAPAGHRHTRDSERGGVRRQDSPIAHVQRAAGESQVGRRQGRRRRSIGDDQCPRPVQGPRGHREGLRRCGRGIERDVVELTAREIRASERHRPTGRTIESDRPSPGTPRR